MKDVSTQGPTRPAKGRRQTRRPTKLTGPLLQFDLTEEMEQLRTEEAWQRTGRNAKTLVKHSDLRIVLTMMKAGTRCQQHKADARISVHTLRGRLRLHLPEHTVDLPAGHLLALDRAMRHDVEAVKESAFLLSISWSGGGNGK